MKKSDRPYEPHLSIREFSVPAGEEWVSSFTGWSVVQIAGGTGYCLHPQFNHELETGTVVLMAQGVSGTVRASRLGGLSLCRCI